MPRPSNASPESPAPGDAAQQSNEAQAEQEQPSKPTGPMIRFIGRDSSGKKLNPPTSLHGVIDITELPDASEQVSGFYHERHRDILRAYPRLYKRVQFKDGQPLPEPEPEGENEGVAEENSEVTDNG